MVRRENASSYTYLLQQAMRSKQMKKFLNNRTTTCFTDGQNGVDAVVAKLCPLTEIHNCLEHLLRSAGRVGKVSHRLHTPSIVRNTSGGCLGLLQQLSALCCISELYRRSDRFEENNLGQNREELENIAGVSGARSTSYL